MPVQLLADAVPASTLAVVLADGRVVRAHRASMPRPYGSCWPYRDSDSAGLPGRTGAAPLLVPFQKVAQHIPSGRHYLIEGLTLPSWVISDEQRTA